MIRVTVSDFDSPSYFVASAAVLLGYFEAEGLAAEFAFNSGDGAAALRAGRVDFLGSSAYSPLRAFPDWQGVKLLCALSQHTYWFLAVRADLGARQGEVDAVKGLRISAADGPSNGLRFLLTEAGIHLDRDNVRIVKAPQPEGERGYQGTSGIRAIKLGLADAYWGNGMRAALGVQQGVATVLLDVRRGDGPAGSLHYTFPALSASERLIKERPHVAEAAVRAVVKAQNALKADPSLAAGLGARYFPADEAPLIEELIRRDTPFYSPEISETAIAGLNRFTQSVGLVSKPFTYDDIVAAQFRHLWSE